MKNKIYFLVTTVLLGAIHNDAGAGICSISDKQPSVYDDTTLLVCEQATYASASIIVYDASAKKYYSIQQCECPTNLTAFRTSVPGCSNMDYVYTCGCECTIDCESDTNWANGNTGYQTRISRTCDCSSGKATCNETHEYRCAKGYYGKSTNGTSGCTRCAPTTATTQAAGATKISDCYIPKGTTFTDDMGSGTYAEDCWYDEGIRLEPLLPLN